MTGLQLSSAVLNLSRIRKRAVAISLDIAICLFYVAAAFAFRLDYWSWPTPLQSMAYVGAVSLSIPIFIRFGLYRAIFRYAGWDALVSVAMACALYALAYGTIFTLIGINEVPRTVGILQPILLFVLVALSRAVARFWLGGIYRHHTGHHDRRHVLIYGAGSAGRQLAAGLANSHEMRVVAFVDDDPTLHGSLLSGKPIHSPARLAMLITGMAIDDVLLAIPSASRQRRNEILEALRDSAVSVRTLPGIADLAHGRVTVNDLRPLDIEDLLGRDPVPPNRDLMGKCITGKCVLVTGAGGSIGSELCRQILVQSPKRLVLFDHSEFNLYSIEQDLRARLEKLASAVELVPILGSVQDSMRMNAVFTDWTPETVYHAAAYKHVPLVEENPAEGVLNNIFGTRTVAEAAEKHGVCDFVLISTDKAVRPTNVMGATKRVAEMILQAMAADGSKTRFSMVRFGNVLGSSGSVVPLFRKQIAAGGPVTVTHEDITRYFMTIPEAAQLVIQAGAMAQGGEVFVLDMGEPVKIVDLARRMIELSGLSERNHTNPTGDIEIKVVGLRPAEKLYEELLIGENPELTSHRRIMKARDQYVSRKDLRKFLEDIRSFIVMRELSQIISKLKELVPEFSQDRQSDTVSE